jgi:general secretion pathway protein G
MAEQSRAVQGRVAAVSQCVSIFRANRSRRHGKGAFTLIEVLVVIAILLILSGLLFPVFAKAKDTAKDRVCASNESQIYKAIVLYMNDHDDYFPKAKDCNDKLRSNMYPMPSRLAIRAMPMLQDALQPYVANREVFGCPRDTGAHVIEAIFPRDIDLTPTAYQKCGLSYEYHTVIGYASVSHTQVQALAGVNLLADLVGNWHSGEPPLLPTDNMDDYLDGIQVYRYNVLYVDGHVKRVTHSELEAAWRRQ